MIIYNNHETIRENFKWDEIGWDEMRFKWDYTTLIYKFIRVIKWDIRWNETIHFIYVALNNIWRSLFCPIKSISFIPFIDCKNWCFHVLDLRGYIMSWFKFYETTSNLMNVNDASLRRWIFVLCYSRIHHLL